MGQILVSGGGGIDHDELTALKEQVLLGCSAVTKDSENDDGEIGIGTMPNNGAVTRSINPSESVSIELGYHNGDGYVTVPNLSEYTEADASAAYVRKGYTCWVNGKLIDGSLTSLYW